MFCLSLELNYNVFSCQMGLVRVSLVVSLLLCWVGLAVSGRPGRRGRGRSHRLPPHLHRDNHQDTEEEER